VAYIGNQPTIGQYRKLDDISGSFNGSLTAFTMQVGSTNVSAGSVFQLLISLGGVIQNPGTDFTVSGSTLTFTTAPTSGLDFFGILMGQPLNTATPGDSTVTGAKIVDGTITGAKLAAGFNYDSGLLFLDDTNNRVGIGTSSPARNLAINGSASEGVVQITNNTSGTSVANGLEIIHFTNGETDINNRPNASLRFSTNGTEKMRINGSGNVGIGTTSPATTFVVDKSDASGLSAHILVNNSESSSGLSLLGAGSSFSSGGWPSLTDCGIIRSSANSSNGVAIQAPVGAISFWNSSEAARIDSSGRLLVGTSTSSTYFGAKLQVEGTTQDTSSAIFTRNSGNSGPPSLYLAKSRGGIGAFNVVANNDGLGSIYFSGADGTTMRTGAAISAYVEGTPGANDMPGRLTFSTTSDGASSPTERMRITADGTLLTFGVANGIVSGHSAAAGTSAQLFMGIHSRTSTTVGGTTSFQVYTNGNVQNTNNSYGAISDIKLKENIVDANSQWDDLKAVQVRKYNFKEETGNPTHTQIGVIAQELELVSPGLVYESPDRETVEIPVLDENGNPVFDENGDPTFTTEERETGEVTKSVNYSVLYMKAFKALQEAMERIETLEGMVAVNNITIDEQQHQLSTLAARLTALESA
jgi:hypothetical protein